MKHFLICILFILTSVAVFPQQKDKRINLKTEKMPLQDVLKEISKQADIPISYSVNQIPVNAPVTVDIKNKTLNQALDMVCKPLKLKYVFVENQIVIKPRKEVPDPDEVKSTEKSKMFTISGHVNDESSMEVVPGAAVYTSDIKYGITTNGYGFYSLTLPEGKYTIICSYLGYKTDSVQINLNQNIKMSFKLKMEEIALQPIEISVKEDSNKLIVLNRLGFDEPSPAKLARMPVFFSEPDVVKAMQFMPGIKNTIDGSSYYFVRGGERDQNLILLDDAPLYNPSHLFGFFTAINPETLTEIKLHKSDFPVHVGGKISSVLELKTKEGNRNKLGMSGEWGLLTTRLSFEGPLFKKTSSFYISSRSSTLGLLIQAALKDIDKFSFNDLHFKYNITINPKNRIFYSFYGGLDRFIKTDGIDKQGIQWGNFLTSLRWNRIWNQRLFSNSVLYGSVYSYDLYQSFNTNTRWNSMIATMGLKNDFTFYRTANISHQFGYHVSYHSFNPGVILSDIDYTGHDIPAIQTLSTGESSIYYSNQRKLFEKFSIRAGFRLSTFANYGPAEYYLFDDEHQVSDTIIVSELKRYNTYFKLAPSATATYLLTENNSLKINYFRAYQNHQVLSNSISPFTSIEVWYPSTVNVLPQAVDQMALGWYHLIRNLNVNLSVEVFGKKLYNQFDYENQASLFLNPLIEKELRFGTTRVHGFEIMLRKETGRLQGWIGYAYTRAFRTIEGVNYNEPYPAYSDRPIDLSMFLRWQPGQRWLYTLGMIYASGMPYTTPTGYYDYQGYKVPVYTQKNNSKMPDYFRTDISAQYMLNKPHRKFKHYVTFSIYNLTNHKNPSFIHFNKMIDDDGKFVVPSEYSQSNQLQPSQMIMLGIIPSFKYNFHF